MADAEEKCLAEWRKNLLCNLSGDVLEIGCGTGANLPYYPKTIQKLMLAEPNARMRRKLNPKLAQFDYLTISLLEYNGSVYARCATYRSAKYSWNSDKMMKKPNDQMVSAVVKAMTDEVV